MYLPPNLSLNVIFSLLADLELAFPFKPKKPHYPVSCDVVWKKPQVGWLKLNTDASVRHCPDSVGIGGVIRNNEGDWVCGFHGRIGACSVITAELWAIREGLLLAWNRIIPHLEVETDSEMAIKLIKDGNVRDQSR